MQVKKYVAKSMKDALKLIKEELGPEAVILAAREMKKSGIKGGPQSEVEVTAAVSDFTLHKKKFTESRMNQETKERFKNTPAKSQKNIINKVVERKLASSEQTQPRPPSRATSQRPSQLSKVLGVEGQTSQIENRKRNITAISYIDIPDDDSTDASLHVTSRSGAPRPHLPPRAQHPRAQELIDESSPLTSRSISRIRSAAKEAFTAGLAALDGPNHKPSHKSPFAAAPVPAVSDSQRDPEEDFRFENLNRSNAGPQIEVLQSEIERLQTLLKQTDRPKPAVHSHPGAEFGIHYEMSFMFQKLLESGINVETISTILLQAQKEMDVLQMKKRPLVDAFVARWFLSHTKIVADCYQGRTHLFVGPAGSGKTSMLVKWASELSLKKKKRIAILTADTQKVGAVDQLKIYAQILNVPFIVIRSSADWTQVLSQFAHIDHFLVDYPGMQLKDLNEIDFLRAMLPPPEVAAVSHLVLNCIAKDKDCLDNCKRFRLANYQDLIFTNLDQSVQHGVIVNVQRELDLPLNSFGIGNSIPEDFEEATKERILDLIFKLTRLQRGVNANGI